MKINKEKAKVLIEMIEEYGHFESCAESDFGKSECIDSCNKCQLDRLQAIIDAPEKKYRPFKNAEEFEPHREWWVMQKESESVKTKIGEYGNKGILLNNEFMFYSQLLNDYTFEDGTPCGVEER